MDIKNLTNGGAIGGKQGAGGIYFFDIFLYYFINAIIKTYISSFCCCLRYIFTHSSCYSFLVKTVEKFETLHSLYSQLSKEVYKYTL